MSKAEKLVEILNGMSEEWIASPDERVASRWSNAELVAGVVAEARAAALAEVNAYQQDYLPRLEAQMRTTALRELREEIVANEDEWDTTYSARHLLADPSMSKRELQVLRMSATGMTYAEIGSALGISPRTVGVHHENIYRVLNVRNKTEAFIKMGWLVT